MANDRNLHVQLTLDADTKAAQNQIKSLVNDLQKIQSIPQLNFDDAGIRKASAAAQELQQHLLNAVNVNTGKLDLTKFSASLSQSDKLLEDYYKDLIAIGDQGQEAFLKVAQSIASADAPLLQANNRVKEFLGTLQNTARWQISSSVLHGFMGAIQSAYGYAQDLNKSLNNIQIVTGASSDQMAEFAKQANKAAQELNTTTTRYTNASLIYYQQGLSAEEVQKRTEVTIKMANAAGETAETVSQQMTAVWNNFYDGSKSLEYYADVMTALGAATASSTSEIAEGIQKFASIGETVGLSYEYAASALATITATTRESADTVGNALKSLFSRIQGLQLGDTLEDGTNLNKYSAALAKVGVDIKNANGELKDMDVILDELGEKWQSISRDQQVALAETVAGQRQYAQMMTLMNNWDFFKENLDTAYGSEGTVSAQAEIFANSWEASSNRVRAALEEVYANLVDDSFFTSLNNVLAVIVNRIANITSGMGGMSGILGTIGSFITNRLAKEAPDALRKISEDILIISGKAREMGQDLQSKNISFLDNFNTAGLSETVKLQIEAISTQAKMKADLVAVEGELTAAEKATYEQQIKNVEATYKNIEGYAKELDYAKEESKLLENRIKSQARSYSSQNGESFNSTALKGQIENLREYQQELTRLQQIDESFGNQISVWEQEAPEVDELKTKVREYIDYLQETKHIDINNKSVQELLKALDDTGITTEQLIQKLYNVKSDAFVNMDTSAKTAGLTIGELDSRVEKLRQTLESKGIHSDTLDDLVSQYEKATTAEEKYAAAQKILQEISKESVTHQVKLSEALTKVSAAAMSFSSVLSSAKRVGEVWKDEDASLIDKITTSIGLFITATRLASQVSQTFGTIEAWLSTASGGHAVAKGVETAAIDTNTGAINTNKVAISTHPILGIVTAALSVAIPLIATLTGNIESNTTKLKENASASKAVWEASKEQKKTNDELITTYEEALKVWQETGTGRQALVEATDAVCKAFDIENEKILLATENYDGLKEAIYKARDAELEAASDDAWNALGSAEKLFNAQMNKKADDIYSDVYDEAGNYVGYQKTGTQIYWGDKTPGFDNNDTYVEEAYKKLKDEGSIDRIFRSEEWGSRGDISVDLGMGSTDEFISGYKQVLKLVSEIQHIGNEKKDQTYQESVTYNKMVDFLSEMKDSYEDLIALREEYADIDIEKVVRDTEKDFTANNGTIKTKEQFDLMRDSMIEAAQAEIQAEDSLLSEEEAREKAISAVDAHIKALGRYNDLLTESQTTDIATEQADGKFNDKQIEDFYSHLSDESKQFFLEVNWELVSDDEEQAQKDIEDQIDKLKEQAEKEENRINVRVQLENVTEAMSNLKEKMSASDYQDFQYSSGIDWGNEELGIIQYDEFLQKSYQDQVLYLENLSNTLKEKNKANLQEYRDDTAQALSDTQSEIERKQQQLANLQEAKKHAAPEERESIQEVIDQTTLEINNLQIDEDNLQSELNDIDAEIKVDVILEGKEESDIWNQLESTSFKLGDRLSSKQISLLESAGGINLDDFSREVGDGTREIYKGFEELGEAVHLAVQQNLLDSSREDKISLLDGITSQEKSDEFEAQIARLKAAGIDVSEFYQELSEQGVWAWDTSSEAYQKYVGAVESYNSGNSQEFLNNIKSFEELNHWVEAGVIEKGSEQYKYVAEYLKDIGVEADIAGDGLEELNAKFDDGSIQTETYQKAVLALFSSGDITLQEALDAIYERLENHTITAEDARTEIAELLSQSSVTTEERLAAINEEIAEGIANADTYSEKLKLIMGDENTTSQTKFDELGSKRYNGSQLEYTYSAEDRYAGYMQLAEDDSLSWAKRQEAIELAEQALQEMNITEDEHILKTQALQEAQNHLNEETGRDFVESVEEARERFSENGQILEENWQAFGDIIKSGLGDIEGTAEEKMALIQAYLEQYGLTLEDVGLKAEDFGTKTQESFKFDDGALAIDNLQKLNEAYASGSMSIEEYHEKLKELLQGELDWSIRQEDATALLYNFEVGLAKTKGTLKEVASSLGASVSSFEDYESLMTAMESASATAEEKSRAQSSALLTLGKQYDSCKSAVSKYEATLRSGTKAQQEAAASELELMGRSAELAGSFGLNEGEVQALAQSYMNLTTWVDENGERMQMNAEIAADLAARDVALNEGIADLQSNWESYSGALEQLQTYYDSASGTFTDMYSAIEGQSEALDGLKNALGEVLNITDTSSISEQFLAENADLVAQAMEGESEAVEALQLKLAEGLQAELFLDDEQFQEVAARAGVECENLADWLQNLPEGQITANDLQFVQELVDAMYQAGMAQEDIEDKLSGLGIDIDTEPYLLDLNDIEAATEELANALNITTQEASDMIAENLAIDSESVVSKEDETQTAEAAGWKAIPNPIESEGSIPTFTTTTFPYIGPFPILGTPATVKTVFPGMTAEPETVPQETTTQKMAIGLKVKGATKTAGGNVSHKNISGGNKTPSRSSGSTPRSTTPRTPTVRTGDVRVQNPAPILREVFNEVDNYQEKTFDKKEYIEDTIDSYLQKDPQKNIVKLTEDKDEVYTTRKKFYNERYDKDKKVDEKEYETKDSSLFLRLSDEIDRYHDVENVLDKIQYKLQEIDQRKSRAFGQAHIDAINEEKNALEEQLEAQNEYISEMATRRKELQETMKSQGWEFDEDGSISNYLEKKTADVLKYNESAEKYVETANKNAEEWNKAAHEVTDNYNSMNREAVDVYNSNMNTLTDETNSKYANLDSAINAANATATAGFNNAKQAASDNEYLAKIAAKQTYESSMQKSLDDKNSQMQEQTDIYNRSKQQTEDTRQSDIRAADAKYNNEMGTALANKKAAEERALAAYQQATSGLAGTYEESAAKTKQAAADKAYEIYQNSLKEIKNDYDNTTKTLEAEHSKSLKDAETKASNANSNIENTYKLAETRINAQFKTAQTTNKNMLDAANANAEQAYKVATENAQHSYNVAIQNAKTAYDRGKRAIDENWEDQSHVIQEVMQDMKDAATSYYEEAMEQVDDQYARAEALNQIAQEQYQFAYQESENMRQEYEQLEDDLAQAMLSAQELRNKIYDNALEVIDYTLNLKVEISEQVVTALGALLDSLGDVADKASDRIAVLSQEMYQFTYQVKANRDAIYDLINSFSNVGSDVMNRFMQGTFSKDDLDKLFNTDEFTADKIANLESYRDNLIAIISSQRALKDQMFENVNGAFTEYQNKLNTQIEKIQSLTKITDTYGNIVGIIGKKVLDVSGELSRTLTKAAFETQRDQTHTYKSILDEMDSNIADLRQQQKQFTEGSEMWQDFQKQLDDWEAQRRSAQDNWLSSWEAEMQAASDYYADAIDTITMKFDQGVAGFMGSLDLLKQEYDRQKEISDVYVDDYEKIYQLSKLTRDVENAIDDSDHVKNKQKLKKLQEEINKANEDGVKMSQYDLDVLRKKFELELARDQLEEARDAKSRVRMTRDSEGNYGYVYTADANAVADAEQNYEDKLHELQVLSSEYIEQLEANYLELQQNVRDEIANLDITQFGSEEEYLAEVERIQSAAIELQERYSQQMGNALGNNNELYNNEWKTYSEMTGYKISADEDYIDKFEETTYSVLTGFKTMDEAKESFTSSLAEAITSAIQAYQETMTMNETAMEDGSTSMKDFAKDAMSSTEDVVSQSQELAEEAETMSQDFQNAFENIAIAAGEFAENYVRNIQPVIDANIKLADTIAKIIEHQANLNGTSGDGSGSGGIASGVKSNSATSDWTAFASDTEENYSSKIGPYLPYMAAVLQYSGYESNYNGWGTIDERKSRLEEVFGAGAVADLQKYMSEHAATDAGSYWLSIAANPSAYSYETMKKMSLDTGGYTGEWNSSNGRLALLHEKELVLNSSDTANILAAVDIIRNIAQTIDLNAQTAGQAMAAAFTAATVQDNNQVLQQQVTITAEFPNATDRDEIIEAFDNLTNLALQYAGKQ